MKSFGIIYVYMYVYVHIFTSPYPENQIGLHHKLFRILNYYQFHNMLYKVFFPLLKKTTYKKKKKKTEPEIQYFLFFFKKKKEELRHTKKLKYSDFLRNSITT